MYIYIYIYNVCASGCVSVCAYLYVDILDILDVHTYIKNHRKNCIFFFLQYN